jgi:transcription-repair coupling factor (superfamily II helicase)
VESVAEHGEYAVRGSLIDLFPAGETHALRLDFFGDEIESFAGSIRRTSVLPTGQVFTLMPASEACWTKRASSASAPAIARRSEGRRPAIRSTKQSPTAAA